MQKHMCDVCGGVCGGIGYKMADGKWCCRECFGKTKLRNPEDLNRMSADTVTALKLRSEEKSPYELNITKMHEEREAQSNKEFAPVRIFIGIVFLAIVFISMIVMVVETSDFAVSTYGQVERIIKRNVDSDLGDDITNALYDSGAFINGFDMDKNDVVYLGDGEYELYVGITVRVIIKNKTFKIYTYYTQYTNDTRILLYDSIMSKPVKVLRDDEHEAIKKKQRNILVDSTLNLNWSDGEIGDDSSKKSSYFTITFKNLGDKTIEYMSIKAWEKYDTDGRPNISYKTKRGEVNGRIEPGKSESYIVSGHGWSFERSIVLAEIVIYYEDGTVIELDEYDCKLLL